MVSIFKVQSRSKVLQSSHSFPLRSTSKISLAYVSAFREMFYDFVAHSELPMVQAAIRYLRQLSEREPDSSSVSLRRYLAVLGNLPLREKVFGF